MTPFGPLFSDHFTVLCKINLRNSDFEKKRIFTRKIKDIDIAAFKLDIKEKLTEINIQHSDLNFFVTEFSKGLQNVLDRHAPVQSKLVSQKPRCPWLNEDIRAAKRERRRCENRLSKTNTKENREKIGPRKTALISSLDTAKKSHYQCIIADKRTNAKDLFNAFNTLTGSVKPSVYPKAESDKDTADKFVHYFKDKIEKICEKFDRTDEPPVHKPISIPDELVFNKFKFATDLKIEKYILKSPSTTCPLDPIPTDLLKMCIKETLPVIVLLLNRCLETGTMPQPFKEALVIPLLKKRKT